MEEIVTRISSAVTTRTLYPATHPRVVNAVTQVCRVVREITKESHEESITLLIVGDDLVIQSEVVRRPSLSQRQFIDTLRRRGIERLTVAEGLEEDEAHALVEFLTTGESVPTLPHVVLGRVHVAVDEESGDDAQHELTVDQLDPVREAFARFRVEKTLPLAPMEQLVWSFIDSLSRATRDILPLAKLKEHDEYTFIHSVNVSLLVIAMAKAFGFRGPALHTFGMAALLHDIGKLMVPLDVLNAPGKLDGEQWTQMQSHAQQGAWYLSGAEGSPPLSILVAYEHHLRFDGQPNYPILPSPRIPNLASRMTSIADAYDAMSTVRPYQQPLGRAAAIQILQKRSESFYDPVLVATFTQIVADR